MIGNIEGKGREGGGLVFGVVGVSLGGEEGEGVEMDGRVDGCWRGIW